MARLLASNLYPINISKETYLKILQIAHNVRKHILNMIFNAQSGHPGGSLSCTDILVCLYHQVLSLPPPSFDFSKKPYPINSDIFILSKGHSVPALYAVLAEKDYISKEELKNFRKFGSNLQGHPKGKSLPTIEVSTGSLGIGASISIGYALSAKIDGTPRRVYALLGDGECNEGIIWESAMAASNFHLDNLIYIIDRNAVQLDGDTEDIMSIEPFAEKWESFGWNVIEIDGNSIEELLMAFNTANHLKGRPTVIIAYMIKGQGVEFMHYVKKFHGGPPDQDEYNQALLDLNTYYHYRLNKLVNFESFQGQNDNIEIIKDKEDKCYYPKLPKLHKKIKNNISNDLISQVTPINTIKNYNFKQSPSYLSLREQFGNSLMKIGCKYPEIVVLDADLSSSTKTNLFQKKYPERFFNMGICEQNMVGAAIGFASSGKITFVSGFTCFTLSRAWEMIRFAALDNLPLKICTTHAGFSPALDGGTHQAIEDLSLMASIPNMKIYTPCDHLELEKIIDLIVNEPGPCYVRLMRNSLPWVFKKSDPFQFSTSFIYQIYSSEKEDNNTKNDYSNVDLTIFSCGSMSCYVAKIAERINQKGISLRCFHFSRIKPLNTTNIKTISSNTTAIITLEEHNIIAGFGSQISRIIAEHCPKYLLTIGINDLFGQTGKRDQLMKEYLIDIDSIVETIINYYNTIK